MSVRILALDVSTCTGYAFWSTDCHVSSIECGVIEIPEPRKIPNTADRHDYDWDDWRVAQMGPKIHKLIKHFKPDFVLIEKRLRFSKSGDAAFAMTQALHGVIYGYCCIMGIVFGTVSSQSWRKAAYPNDFERPMLPSLDRKGRQKIDEKTGKPAFKPKDWGDIAVEQCRSLSINLSSRNEIAHNAAEAALIALAWRCKDIISVPSERGLMRYHELRDRRTVRSSHQLIGAAA